MTEEDLLQHTLAIAAAKDKNQFVAAFAAYVKDCVERETDPYEKIAGYVHGMVGGMRETIAELVKYRGGGTA
jgi:hypothetical protein